MFRKRIALISLLLGLALFAYPQKKADAGGKAGITFQFGTHYRRLGVMYQLYYFDDFIQVNQGVIFNFNFKNSGPDIKGFEIQVNLGVQFPFENEQIGKKYYLSEYSLMANKQSGIGYMYIWYFDKVYTSQTTGTVFINAERFGLVFQNDYLSFWRGYEDKYRTGAVALTYGLDSFQIALQTTHWTGKTVEVPSVKDTDYPAKFGYKDLSNATYGKISHGILALRADYNYKYNQAFRFESGIDAEQVRQALQNRLMHDCLISLFDHDTENPHYPMLQDDGTPYLFKDGQKVRPAKPYIQFGMNPGMLY